VTIATFPRKLSSNVIEISAPCTKYSSHDRPLPFQSAALFLKTRKVAPTALIRVPFRSCVAKHQLVGEARFANAEDCARLVPDSVGASGCAEVS
jgi:hypothetical protein